VAAIFGVPAQNARLRATITSEIGRHGDGRIVLILVVEGRRATRFVKGMQFA
jgi:hypothetical protein